MVRISSDPTVGPFRSYDISQGATLSIPDSGDRYLSVMIVNQDHYANKVINELGDTP